MIKSIPKQRKTNKIIKDNKNKSECSPLYFTFDRFKASSVNINGKFNNFYKDVNEYVRKMSIFIGKALPLLSQENSSLFKDNAKNNQLHLHKVINKRLEIETILKEYGFPDDEINSIFEGARIYQFEVPYENGAFRVVFELIDDNVISFLFFDPNHHIYLNKSKVKESNSLFYEYCPIFNDDKCDKMKFLKTCFAFEYLDIEKIKSSFLNDYSPD